MPYFLFNLKMVRFRGFVLEEALLFLTYLMLLDVLPF